MLFRTELTPKPTAFQLNHAAKVVTAGSCFSEVIGQKLEKYKVETLTNPFGTIFNPLSVCKLLQVCAGADVELADSFVENNGRWFSFDFHSSFSATSEEELYENLDEVIVKTRRFLKQTDVLILTFGTANVYRHNISGETVANCHKLPGGTFCKETLLPEEIINAVAETHSLLRELNPNLKLVLTVSPVRHIKDTLELNSVSKAVLRLATHYLSQQLPGVTYFPSYELLLDDLRDYRFYKEDLLHPTAAAEQYIWEKFRDAYFDVAFRDFTQDWDRILRALEHKPFYPETPGHQAFVQQMLEKLRGIQTGINVEKELAYFENQVIIPPAPVEEEEEETEEEEIPEIVPAEIIAKPVETSLIDTAEASENEVEDVLADLLPAGKKRKKKPRKKKKKPFGLAETQVIAEGSPVQKTEPENAMVSEEKAVAQEEVISGTPVSVGETSTEITTSRPIVPAKSKSAKRRESRKKKKTLAAQDSTEAAITYIEPISEVSEVAQQENDLIEVNSPEPVKIATIAEPETKKLVSLQVPETAPEIKTSKSRGRGKKPKMQDLFASTPAIDTVAEVPFAENLPLAIPTPETKTESAEIKAEAPKAEEPKVEPAKKRGRQKRAISAGEFLDAATHTQLPETEVVISSVKSKATRKPRAKAEIPKPTPNPKKTPKAALAPKKAAKPKALKEVLAETEIKPEKKKPGRKKKTQAES